MEEMGDEDEVALRETFIRERNCSIVLSEYIATVKCQRASDTDPRLEHVIAACEQQLDETHSRLAKIMREHEELFCQWMRALTLSEVHRGVRQQRTQSA
jgi:hypothetical protein